MQNPFNNQDQNDPNNPLNQLPIPPNYAKIRNQQGEVRIAKVGISWTTFFFGPLPALFRGDWYNFALMMVWDLIYVLGAQMFRLGAIASYPWPGMVFTLIYNMMYFRHLIGAKDFYAADARSEKLLENARYLPHNYKKYFGDDDDNNDSNNFFN